MHDRSDPKYNILRLLYLISSQLCGVLEEEGCVQLNGTLKYIQIEIYFGCEYLESIQSSYLHKDINYYVGQALYLLFFLAIFHLYIIHNEAMPGIGNSTCTDVKCQDTLIEQSPEPCWLQMGFLVKLTCMCITIIAKGHAGSKHACMLQVYVCTAL